MDLCLEQTIKKIRFTAVECGESTLEAADGMENLPWEIVLDILSRLPATSVAQFSFVCRSWRSMTRDPLLPAMQLSRTAERDPFLVLHCDCPIRNQLSFVELSAFASDAAASAVAARRFTPPTADFEVIGMCNGVMCLWDLLYRESHYLYNPFTGDKLLLPVPEQFPSQEVVFGFGLDPTTRSYKVLKIVYYNYTFAPRRSLPRSEVQILTVGESRWRSLGKVHYQVARRPAEALLLHGRLHWMTRQRRYRDAPLVAFDLAKEAFVEIPKPESGALNWRNYQLAALGGCFCAVVHFSYGRVDIWVMKVYGKWDTWQKEYTIGAHVPKGLKPIPNPPLKMCKGFIRRVRALCLLEETGEILMEYKGRALMAYDPQTASFRDLSLKGIPNWFQSYISLGTLSWIDSHSAA